MNEEIKFEKAMERLEKIVEDLENGNIPLEEALKKYEEGVKLSKVCQKRLSQAEKKIEILTRALDGSLQPEPFDFEAAGEDSGGAKPAKEMRPKNKTDSGQKGGEEEGLLF